MRDRVGRELTVGDWIVYGIRKGNSEALGFGKIKEIHFNYDLTYAIYNKKPALTVDSVQDYWHLPQKRKIVRLYYPERVAKVDPPQKLLEELEHEPKTFPWRNQLISEKQMAVVLSERTSTYHYTHDSDFWWGDIEPAITLETARQIIEADNPPEEAEK